MLTRLRFVREGCSADDLSYLRREFPGLDTEGATSTSADVAIDGSAWAHPAWDAFAFDAVIVPAVGNGNAGIDLRGPCGGRAAISVATRYQRFVPRRIEDAVTLERVFARHRALHDLRKPLVAADHDHALDTWAWMLRLDPTASLSAQLAALFHDIERLTSEADARIEQHAADYPIFKAAHARAGAAMTSAVLEELGIDEETRARVAELVADHERPNEDRELALLNDADALSFFSLNSAGFLRYYGLDHTRRKVRRSLTRLSSAARMHLARIRLPAEVERFLSEAMRSHEGSLA
jgi:hypothetical protein